MADMKELSADELTQLEAELAQRLETFKQQGLNLNMTRGKPGPEQLDLANGMLELANANDFKSANGTDCRNYGVLDGIPEAKALFADYMEAPADNLIIGGNSSLSLMHDAITQALLHGVPGGEQPWAKIPGVKFLCPAPGYDRHFSICEHFGIEMITIDMLDTGPDMNAVEELIGKDATIKGIWCVPKYSNPTGVTFSDKVVDRLAAMKTAAPDFRIFWDNAYHVHTLTDDVAPLKNILKACEEAGNADRPLMFGSTSKVSFAGAGVGVIAASQANIAATKLHMSKQTIGCDKLNQLRHVRFFKNLDGIHAHMQKHASILKPRFDTVQAILDQELGEQGIATWSKPTGGYFVSLNTLEGCARDVVALAKDAGVQLTGAGATYPYKKDPRDSNIRLAPSLPSLEEIKLAMEVVTTCVRLVSARKLLK